MAEGAALEMLYTGSSLYQGFESLTLRSYDPLVKLVKTPAFHAGNVGPNPARVTFGGLAQLGERLPYKQRVTGSSPVSSINNLIVVTHTRWLGSSVGRATD